MLKRGAHLLGLAMVLGSLFYVGKQLWVYRQQLGEQLTVEQLLHPGLSGGIAYGMLSLLLGAAWAILLPVSTPWHARYTILAKSQIAKYLPGNLFHFVGIYLLGKQVGIDAKTLGKALFYFTALTLISALCMTVPILPKLAAMVPVLHNLDNLILWLTVILLFIVSLIMARRYLPEMTYSLRPLSISLGLQLIFHLGAGWIFVWQLPGPHTPMETLFLIQAYLATWAVGYITPGSPGGIGIREGGLLLLLAPLYGEPATLYAALMMRGVTTVGDFLFFFSGVLIRKKPLMAPGS
ncbi:hypothetical protein [Magnetococcus sp. PR-3]|uniref:hypothetical protein n=1 Tax=Magnetococcus sp. PR-3 TaxID=3120355 RepID=UPI002FCE17A4